MKPTPSEGETESAEGGRRRSNIGHHLQFRNYYFILTMMEAARFAGMNKFVFTPVSQLTRTPFDMSAFRSCSWRSVVDDDDLRKYSRSLRSRTRNTSKPPWPRRPVAKTETLVLLGGNVEHQAVAAALSSLAAM